ncbi:winged helix-turn-helix domain-containing protein [Maridesulfovibrio bastinii]|uniref:winged helix-turn-helix domain-containing protein n=1 Tax=Maridesulfovibrio bastinii TaxID=47157 RepID=UPI00040677EE|nr:LysR family transcriptional regulator [Maridesulfovibrio bastinii]
MSEEESLRARVRMNLWLENDEGVMFGLGRAQLLKLIDELGSLNKAAKKLGMSYRAAWGRIKSTEEVLGDHIVEKSRGRSGYNLTPLGIMILNEYKKWQADVESYALVKAREFFPWDIQPYKDFDEKEESQDDKD